MTRLIDADGLIKTLNEKNIPVDVRVNYQIMNAPTIEPDGDLISRRDVLNMIIVADECEPDLGYMHLHKVVENIPSAESTGAMDEAIQKYIKDGYMQPIREDLISRQDAINALYTEDVQTVKDCRNCKHGKYNDHWDTWFCYNNCKCSNWDLWESVEVVQRGEWVRLEREENVYDLHGVPTWGVNYMCDKCGFITTAIQDHFAQYRWCPSCGARMYKGGEEEWKNAMIAHTLKCVDGEKK